MRARREIFWLGATLVCIVAVSVAVQWAISVGYL